MEGREVRVVKVETLSFLCPRLGCIERLSNQMKKIFERHLQYVVGCGI